MDHTEAFPAGKRGRVARPVLKADRIPGQPWTTARCQRLLRPLLSRIASLRREPAWDPTPSELAEKRVQAGQKRSGSDADGGWRGARKKSRRTYSQRASDGQARKGPCQEHDSVRTAGEFQRGGGNSMGADEDVVASTPILRRARGEIVPSPEQAHGLPPKRQVSGRDAVKSLEDELQKLRPRLSAARFNDYEAIFRAVDLVLKATEAATAPERKGADSLVGMCLRNVPLYLSALEDWERTEAEQNGTKSVHEGASASFHIYSQLESLGGTEPRWSQLRIVVKADTFHAIKKAMMASVFCLDFSLLLIGLCEAYQAFAEAELLLDVVTRREYPCPTALEALLADSDSLRPLVYLRTYGCRHQVRLAFVYRQVAALLRDGLMPRDWLTGWDNQYLWQLANKRIAQGTAGDDITAFVVCSIVLLDKRRHDSCSTATALLAASQKTLITSLAVLAAMRSSGEQELREGNLPVLARERVARVGQNIGHILEACRAELEVGRALQGRLAGPELTTIALFLSSSTSLHVKLGEDVRRAIEAACNTTANHGRRLRGRHHYNAIVSILSEIARHSGRGKPHASHRYLDDSRSRLGTLGICARDLDAIISAAAFSLARQTDDTRDFFYAETFASDPSTHALKLHFSAVLVGYAWEETIGEWVSRSPARDKTDKRRSQRSTVTSSQFKRTSLPTRSSGPSAPPHNDWSRASSPATERTGASGADHDAMAEDHHQNRHQHLGSTRTPASVVPSWALQRASRRVTSEPKVVLDELSEDHLNQQQSTQKRRRCASTTPGIDLKRRRRLSEHRRTLPVDESSEDELGM